MRTKNKLVSPVLKWVGGKRQLLDIITPLLPNNFSTYCELFVGGGALLFDIQPSKAIINDINQDLMLVYKVIKNDVDLLIETLSDFKNESDFFYAVRDWDRDKSRYESLSEVQRAARVIFLNKTCYNGLYRVNNAGEFNSPFGNYKNPNIVNAPVLRAVSNYFNAAAIKIISKDYEELITDIPKGSFVYLDPPYDPVSSTSSFTGYSKGGFTHDDQIRLRKFCDRLDEMCIKFMVSNSSTEFIKEQYSKYNITTVQAKRAINSIASKRGDVDEVIIRNYK